MYSQYRMSYDSGQAEGDKIPSVKLEPITGWEPATPGWGQEVTDWGVSVPCDECLSCDKGDGSSGIKIMLS